ncbi:Thrombospondin type-1 domain-containing protein 7A [Collichthys lucidus]|uniref:Thrombospondin type-1 domain-containing protein 7A n=1 Tax=Collichthys lucidus TaxID=240159 RepID=A0A4V6ASB6_COLLU|nr:Thrombospondin type-1 domain-containing protein 7A [Collichthys lucidus]
MMITEIITRVETDSNKCEPVLKDKKTSWKALNLENLEHNLISVSPHRLLFTLLCFVNLLRRRDSMIQIRLLEKLIVPLATEQTQGVFIARESETENAPGGGRGRTKDGRATPGYIRPPQQNDHHLYKKKKEEAVIKGFKVTRVSPADIQCEEHAAMLQPITASAKSPTRDETHLVCSIINPPLFPDCTVLSQRMPSVGYVYDTNKQIPNTHSILLLSALRRRIHSHPPAPLLPRLLVKQMEPEVEAHLPVVMIQMLRVDRGKSKHMCPSLVAVVAIWKRWQRPHRSLQLSNSEGSLKDRAAACSSLALHAVGQRFMRLRKLCKESLAVIDLPLRQLTSEEGQTKQRLGLNLARERSSLPLDTPAISEAPRRGGGQEPLLVLPSSGARALDCVLSDWTSWSTCSQTCSSKTIEGKQMRTRSILAYNAGEGGALCPNSSSLQEVRNCNEHACTVYHWQTGPWGPCTEDPSASSLNASMGARERQGSCSLGMQTRKVICVRVNVGQGGYQREDDWYINYSEGQSLLSYKVVGVIDLSRGGLMFDEGHTLGLKYDRHIISITDWYSTKAWTQKHDSKAVQGSNAKSVYWTEERFDSPQSPVPFIHSVLDQSIKMLQLWFPTICLNVAVFEKYSALCVFIGHDPTGRVSYLHLNLCWSSSCYPPVKLGNSSISFDQPSELESYVMCSLSLCVEVVPIVLLRGTIHLYKDTRGFVLLERDLALSIGIKNKSLLVSLLHYYIFPARLPIARLANEYGTPRGKRSLLATLNLTQMISVSTMGMRKQSSNIPRCETRLQRSDYKMSFSRCPDGPRPNAVRPCQLPCKKDCIMTPFSDWTPCPLSCDAAGNAVKRKQSRKRLIIQPPSNGGQDCPEVLEEDRDCEVPKSCPGFRWKTHKWRKCQLVPWFLRQSSAGAQETCGPGLQTRAVSCRQLDGTQADISECLRFAKAMPTITQRCQLPCQDDCQLTNWSKFSSCTADCVGVRTRKRALIGRSKKKDKCKNTQMYPLSETQYCPCDKYNAQPVGNWSDCILPEGGRVESVLGMKVQGDVKECGQGYRYQAMVCYDQDNRLVETLRCNSHGYIEEACIIPCPSDCKLSEWSNWSRCSKSCGSGVKVRSKWLREKPYNGGRPCPKLDHINQVYEVVPCQSDCNQYVWVAEPWSVWKVSNVDLKENCGEGVQTRKVRCMLNTIDGPSESVEDYLCDPEEMPLGARESRLPCPEDCVLNDWGPWSRCSLSVCVSAVYHDQQPSADSVHPPVAQRGQAVSGHDRPRALRPEPQLLQLLLQHHRSCMQPDVRQNDSAPVRALCFRMEQMLFWAAAKCLSGRMFFNFNQITSMKADLEMGALKLSVNVTFTNELICFNSEQGDR